MWTCLLFDWRAVLPLCALLKRCCHHFEPQPLCFAAPAHERDCHGSIQRRSLWPIRAGQRFVAEICRKNSHALFSNNFLCLFCSCAGSPEKIKTLLAAGTCPSWYDTAHLDLSKQGMRVIALAQRKVRCQDVHLLRRRRGRGAGGKARPHLCFFRPVQITKSLSGSELREVPRSWAETDLIFVGFVAFRCLVRKDSAQVIKVRYLSS